MRFSGRIWQYLSWGWCRRQISQPLAFAPRF
jgi:hypothetical protein